MVEENRLLELNAQLKLKLGDGSVGLAGARASRKGLRTSA